MKGIVAQIEGKYAVVLTQDGSFRKVRAEPYMVTGIEIDTHQPAGKIPNIRQIMKVTSIAAAALLALGVGYGAYSYAIPYSYVHLDINPSIELTANIYDRIIKAEALNEDGRKLLEGRSLKNSSIETGISDLLDIAVKKGYLTGSEPQTGDTTTGTAVSASNAGEVTAAGVEGQPQKINNAVILTVSSNNSKKSGNLKKKIMDSASKELDTDKVDSEILIGITSIEQRNEARGLGVTPGKLALIEDAMGEEPELKIDDLKKDSVEELLEKIQEKEKNGQKNGNTGAKAGVKEQSSRKQPSDKSPNSPVQSENATAPKNQGNGGSLGKSAFKRDQDDFRGSDWNQPEEPGKQDQEVKDGSTGSSAVNDKNLFTDWINNQLKNQTQNQNKKQNQSQSQNQKQNQSQNQSQSQSQSKANKRYDGRGNGQEQTGTGVQNKGRNEDQDGDRDEGEVNYEKDVNGKNPVTKNGKQTGSGIGGGNNKKIDEADSKTAGKDANELKIERKQLRDDLLDQMGKQLEERNNISGRKSTKADNNGKYGGKSGVNTNGIKW